MARSFIYGIERGRLPVPLLFGIYTRRNGRVRYPCWHRVVTAWALCSDVSQRTPSTPGGRLPWCSVTRLTARIVAENERVSRRWRARTLPHLPACVAFTIRAWSQRTMRCAFCHLMACQSTALREIAP